MRAPAGDLNGHRPASSLATLLSSTLKADTTNDPVVFNIVISDIAILPKPWMKHW